ncbi:sigma factor-like helix-turn-helix DNA-binding protein [Desulfosporosinus sp. FKB]|uniref:sigma factor-like helix-turn-helix DNA-binding protein n=1 Tax=Desulfosporosinus sp. FKB TaxID=1969835 RepID=UPI000B49B30F|nr:sigma factor-like helix-turn-helix DNA-binding protein [Desulfosporosinus sp. FKB]
MLSKDKVIEAMPKCLNEKEKEILSERWGLNNGIPKRIEELKEIYGITIEQLRNIERKIILYMKET